GEQLSSLADSVKSAGPLEINRLLPAYDQSTDEAVGLKLIEALRDSKAATGLRADTIRTHLAKFGPKVQQEALPLLARLSPDADKQKAKLENLLTTLPKGDIRRGQAVFNSPKVACVSCHAIGYVGGTVGPDLTKVGQVRSERDLLESIVFPSASFVQSYEPVMVITKDGDNQYGIVRRNDAQEVILINGPTQEIHIPKSNVKELRPGAVSIMPEGLDQQITPQELADLLAFLKATKG
ncbi:MAG: putative rane-bound dehydrogenase, partial [Phycisphaerales bacterium]|nr:putative rane-bound dehydrogenase [Phycisphaerales bacterium]